MHPKAGLIVTGDNHRAFLVSKQREWGTQYVVNCGSLTRQAKDEAGHVPHVYTYDPKTGAPPVKHLIPCVRDVFVAEREVTDRMEAFVKHVRSGGVAGLDFRRNLQQHLDHNKVKDSVRKMVMEAIA
jgi:hypothetical protein